MRYMLLIYGAEDCWTEEERKHCMMESLAICKELAAQRKFFTASPLQSVVNATSVRVRPAGVLITEGPFAETTEQLGGYYVLELNDLDEAIAVAARLPPASKGTVEIRPISTLDGILAEPALLPVTEDGSMTPFLLLCYFDEASCGNGGMKSFGEAWRETLPIAQRFSAEGRYLEGTLLHLVATATSVRVRSGQREISDSPFAWTPEVLGGYYHILAKDRETAVRFATQLPVSRAGTVEVRPLFDLSGLRESP